ncbi:glycosyltransferase family 87 protein [Streptomyces sp. NPDC020719]|uniref:glycosyltransferase family 87 protein n=1 Tax=unclassified Streptomyces TaxID=2593676 RepID=UPI0033F2B6CE
MIAPRTATAPPADAPAAAPTAVRRTALTAALLVALAAVLALTFVEDGYYGHPGALSWWYLACWLLFAAAAWSLRRVPAAHRTGLILAGGVLVAATGLAAPPTTSTDMFRYAWDGRVQAAGISPYDHVPADRELAGLRDSWLFPSGAACKGPDRAGIGEADRCTRLNRPKVHTIYPPVAEVYFLGVHELSPPGARHKPLQVGGALLAVATTGVLLLILRRRGDVRGAAYWAWCPAVPIEAVNNAHVDGLAVLFTVAGLGAVAGVWPRLRGARGNAVGGLLIGAGVAAKMLPAVVLPGALSGVLAGRRPNWRRAASVLVPTAGCVALSYLPYVLVSHASVFGYLGGYAEEEGYDDASARSRYGLVRLVLPDGWALPGALVVVALVVLYVLRRGDPRRPWSGALLVLGWAFLLMTPGYSWYALLLVALVALDGRWEWLAVAAAGAVCYVTARAMPHSFDLVRTSAYAVAAAIALAGWVLRRRALSVARVTV